MKRTLASLMPHDVWARLLERRISFVDKMSMQLIATSPLKPFGVVYRAESIEALWDLTEGHPWLTQVVAHQLAPRLNAERRRLVVPNDIEVASFDAAMGGEVGRLWWNESEGSVTAVHRETALILLAHLRGDVRLVEEAELLVAMRAAGIAGGPAILEEMEALQLFAKDDIDGRSAWRFRARFLQRHVEAIAGRASAYGNAPAAERQAAPQELQEVLAFLENIDAKVDKLPDEITARISRLSELDDQWRGLEEQIKNLPETIVDGCRNLAISWVGRPCWDSLSTDSRSDLLGIATMLQNNENDAPPLALTGLFILVERELRLAANRAGVTVERGATLDPLVESLMAELPVHDPLWKAARDIKMANLVAARNRGIHGGAIAERDRDRLVRQLFKNESDDGLVARLTAASRSG